MHNHISLNFYPIESLKSIALPKPELKNAAHFNNKFTGAKSNAKSSYKKAKGISLSHPPANSSIYFSAVRPLLSRTLVAAALGLSAQMALLLPVDAAAQETDLSTLKEVVVTGSRIVRRDFDAASPIVTVDAEDFSQTSTLGVENALNKLPQFVPSQTQFTSNSLTADASSTPGIATLNLRGLGPNRNLVLVDGRRAQPSNALLVVDVNSIPSAAIDTVEIISGGASATYGADAIGGVVNFKLKKNFEGFDLSIKNAGTQHGGGEETQISTLFGANLESGRGNVMLGLDYSTRNEVLQADRDFFVDGWTDYGTSNGSQGTNYARFRRTASNLPNQGVVDSIFGPGVVTGTDEGYFFNEYTGGAYSNVSLFTTGASGLHGYTGPLDADSGWTYTTYQQPGQPEQLKVNQTYLWASTPLERYSIFGRAHFDINENMSVFAQANYSRIEVQTLTAYPDAVGLWNASIPYDGRAIPDELRQLLDSRTNNTANWDLEHNLDFIGPRGTDNTTDVYQIMVGIDGNFGDSGWTYEAYLSRGDTEIIAAINNIVSVSRYRAIVTAPNWGAGWSSSQNAAFTARCTSGIPVFGDFELSQDCRDALVVTMKHRTAISQDIAEINVQGGLFELPAGEVRAAVGASQRENSFSFEPDSLADAQSVLDRPIGLFAVNETAGETEVQELYAEALIPLLSDLPGIQQLDWELGARYSDYDTAGSIWTYKSLFDWRINDNVRVRTGYQLANRAPNVAELYTGVSQNVVPFAGADPCLSNTENTWGNVASNPNRTQVQNLCIEIINKSDNNPANDNLSDYALNPLGIYGPFSFNFPFERIEESGNPDLKNEEAETLTAGVVFDIGTVTTAIDWYGIEITDAVEPINAYFVYSKCLNADGSNPTYAYNEWCSLITRYTTDGYRQTVKTPYSNVGAIKTSGVDLQVNWNTDLAGGVFGLNAVLNYLIEYKTQQNSSSPFIDSTGTFEDGGQFDYKAMTRLSFSKNDWSVATNIRFLPSIEHDSAAIDPNTRLEGAGSYTAIDLWGSWQFSESLAIRGGIDNFLDTDPEIVGREPGVNNAKGSTRPGYYDILGRRYFVALDFSF